MGAQTKEVIDTLAAAHAEAGGFEQAVKWVTKAIKLATSSRKVEYKARLELYQSGKAFRITVPPPQS